LVQQIVAFLVDALINTPVDLKAAVVPSKTTAREFWMEVNRPGGVARAVAMFREARKRDPGAIVFPEYQVNLLGYARLQEGAKDEAIELFKLNTEAYPASANTEDSLSDGYLAAGNKDLALAAEQKCLELLPGDPNNTEFKTQLGNVAREKIAKLKSEQK